MSDALVGVVVGGLLAGGLTLASTWLANRSASERAAREREVSTLRALQEQRHRLYRQFLEAVANAWAFAMTPESEDETSRLHDGAAILSSLYHLLTEILLVAPGRIGGGAEELAGLLRDAVSSRIEREPVESDDEYHELRMSLTLVMRDDLRAPALADSLRTDGAQE
jgi:hypothetical protein